MNWRVPSLSLFVLVLLAITVRLEAVTITGVDPLAVSTGGSTLITITGTDFNAAFHTPRINGIFLREVSLQGTTRFTGKTPPLVAGHHVVDIFDNREKGPVARFTRIEAVPPRLERVEPSLLPTAGGVEVRFLGAGFFPGLQPTFETIPLTNVQFRSATEIRGRSPALAPGVHDARLVADRTAFTILKRAVTAAAPPAVTSVTPREVEAGVEVIVLGTGFRGSPNTGRPITRIRFGSHDLVNPVWVVPPPGGIVARPPYIQGIAPALSPGETGGPKDVFAIDSELGTGVLEGGVVYPTQPDPPPEVTSVKPDEVRAGDLVSIAGRNFTDDTVVHFGEHKVEIILRELPNELLGTAPALDPGEPVGPKKVTVGNSLGSDVLPDGVTYLDDIVEDPLLEAVSPSQVGTQGGSQVRMTGLFPGDDFVDLHQVLVGRAFFRRIFRVNESTLIGTTPLLEPGLHDVAIQRLDDGSIVALLENGLEVIAPPTVTSVQPDRIRSGDEVTILGDFFTTDTTVQFGEHEVPITRRSLPNTLIGVAPALAAREPVGVKDVAARNAFGSSILVNGVTYAGEEGIPSVPGPQGVETSLAEGTARFRWHNPVPYSEILVLDEDDRILRSLPGDALAVELDSLGRDLVPIKLVGVTAELPSRKVPAFAKRAICQIPPPLTGTGTAGHFDMSLRGGHDAADVDRCAELNQGGGGSLDEEIARQEDRRGRGGKLLAPGANISDLESRGRPPSKGRVGLVSLSFEERPNQWTTGFVLEQDAQVLEIAGWYQKIATRPGVELRGHLRQVVPDTGFEDEFTFPDLNVSAAKDWHCVTYFRANKDVGHVPNTNDPNDGPPDPCLEEGELAPIPAGQYVLDLYAVGGDPQEHYFVFADDSRDYELLIRETPCPPYPLVRIRDMTGRRTLPVIQSIAAETLSDDPPTVRLTASGTYLNRDGEVQQVGPGFTDNPDFEYCWTIGDVGGVPTTRTSGSSSSIVCTVEDWGCYDIGLTVMDRSCPLQTTRTYQIAVTPKVLPRPNNPLYSFFFPTPEPSGIYGIVGLNPPPGQGTFDGERPVEFRVLVVPNCATQNRPEPCAAAFPEDLEFALTLKVRQERAGRPLRGFDYVPIPGPEIEVTDLCPDVEGGAKYFHVRIDDIGAIPHVDGADGRAWQDVYFAGRTIRYDLGNGQIAVTSQFKPIGPPLRLLNHPPSLDDNFWVGSFDKRDATYHFTVQTQSDSKRQFPVGDSNAVDLPIEDLEPGNGVPAYKNNLTSGFVSSFMIHGEDFEVSQGTGGTHGDSFGNAIEGEPTSRKGSQTFSQAIHGDGAGGVLGDLPEYHWGWDEEIFSNSINQTIFQSILYTGSVGPVPLTIWASIGLGVDFMMNAFTDVYVRPFAQLTGGGPTVESHFYLCTDVDISIPCEIRADVVFGLFSIAMRLIPEANVDIDLHVGVKDISPEFGLYAGAFLSLLFEIEMCIWLIFDEFCYSPGLVKILDNEPIIEKSLFDGVPADSPCQALEEDDGRGGALSLDALGVGGGNQDLPFRILSTSRTGAAFSSDGRTSLCAYGNENLVPASFDAKTLGVTFTSHDASFNTDQLIFDVLDPSPAFVSNNAALVAWTRQTPGVLVGPIRGQPDRNQIAARQDIILVPISDRGGDTWRHDGEEGFIYVSDGPDWQGPRRADGNAVVAADPSVASTSPPGGEVLVAWVRCEGPYLLEDVTPTEVYEPGTRMVEGKQKPFFRKKSVPTVRPNLREMAIYARRMSFTEALGPAERISPAGEGINVEPTIAYSPSGNTAYCVWVHDSTPEHNNLTDSNLGRNFLFAVYTRGQGWSAPSTVFPNPDDYPGLLEPNIALSGDHEGLLAFTALSTEVPTKDTGLSNSRYVFTSEIENGAFGEPVLIHGECLVSEYGHWPTIAWTAGPDWGFVDEVGGGGRELFVKAPEFTLTYHGVGPNGLRSGSGNVMVSSLGGDGKWTAPVCLTNDDDIHSNVAAAVSSRGEHHSVNINGGSARLARLALGGRGGGLAAERRIQTITTRLEPDVAIASCILSQPFAGPGAIVTATVDIANRGLTCTAEDDRGQSLLTVDIIFTKPTGEESVAASEALPVIEPGASLTVVLDVEMPHEPVKLRAEVSTPLDSDPDNNTRECLFGAPMVADFNCTGRFNAGRERGEACLRWSNPALYEAIWVYRDGIMIASLSGGCTLYTDLYAPPGVHTYEVRGLIGVSKSTPLPCTVQIPEPPPTTLLTRGDINADGQVNISDPVNALNFLFSGGPTPGCMDAVDANDDGSADIADPIFLLNFLFSGAADPAAPYPDCGLDPTEDGLVCETQSSCL